MFNWHRLWAACVCACMCLCTCVWVQVSYVNRWLTHHTDQHIWLLGCPKGAEPQTWLNKRVRDNEVAQTTKFNARRMRCWRAEPAQQSPLVATLILTPLNTVTCLVSHMNKNWFDPQAVKRSFSGFDTTDSHQRAKHARTHPHKHTSIGLGGLLSSWCCPPSYPQMWSGPALCCWRSSTTTSLSPPPTGLRWSCRAAVTTATRSVMSLPGHSGVGEGLLSL